MTAANVPKQLVGGRVYHKPHGAPYAHGCNRETIRDASRAKADYEGIDLDLRISKDGTGWCCHQANPTRKDAWFDPSGHIDDKDPIARLPDVAVRRLRVHYQGVNRPILTAGLAAATCRDVRPRFLIPCFEAKGQDKRFFSVEWWTRFKNSVPANAHPVIMTLPGSNNAGARKLQAAYAAGLPTMWLWRGQPPKGFEAYTDLVKSRPGHPIYRV